MTSKAGKPTIVRFYSVQLWPDETPEGPYEPFTVSLSYERDKATTIDPLGDTALAHVLRRAIKVEGREHGFTEGTTFRLHQVELINTIAISAANAR